MEIPVFKVKIMRKRTLPCVSYLEYFESLIGFQPFRQYESPIDSDAVVDNVKLQENMVVLEAVCEGHTRLVSKSIPGKVYSLQP